MKRVVLLHDAFLNPTDTWYQSVAQIIPKGYELITPELPGGTMQGKEFWMSELEKYRNSFTSDTIVITHGLSSLLAIKFFETLSDPVKLFISVAGTAQVPDHKGYAPIAKTFLDQPVDIEKIKSVCQRIFHIWNKNDVFIDPSFSIYFSEKLPGINFPLNGTDHFVNDAEPELFQVFQNEFNQITTAIIEQEKKSKENAEQSEREKLAEASLSATTTYDTALAKSVSGYQGKVISELLAKARADEELQKQVSIKNPKNILFTIGTILFAAIGIGLLVYGLRPIIDRVAPNFITKQIYNTFMKVEHESIIQINPETSSEILGKLQQLQPEHFEQKAFHAILPVQDSQFLTLADAMKYFETTLPLGLSGKTTNWLYGTYTVSETSIPAPFLILQVNDPEVVQTIMTGWETNIISDTSSLFGFYNNANNEFNSVSEIATEETANEEILVDEIFVTEQYTEEAPVEITIGEEIIVGESEIEITEEELTPEFTETIIEPIELSQEEPLQSFARVIRNNIPLRFGERNGNELYHGFISRNILVITPEPDILQPIIKRLIEQ